MDPHGNPAQALFRVGLDVVGQTRIRRMDHVVDPIRIRRMRDGRTIWRCMTLGVRPFWHAVPAVKLDRNPAKAV